MKPETLSKQLTKDAPTETPSGRYRQIGLTDVADRWAYGRQDEGSRGNIFFRGATIYSYGEHFPMARRVVRTTGEDRKTVFILVTTRRYSPSTNRHQREVRNAISGGWIQAHEVFNPYADTVGAHLENFRRMVDEVERSRADAKKARGNAPRHIGLAKDRAEQANAYAAAVGLRNRINLDTDEFRQEESEAIPP